MNDEAADSDNENEHNDDEDVEIQSLLELNRMLSDRNLCGKSGPKEHVKIVEHSDLLAAEELADEEEEYLWLIGWEVSSILFLLTV